MRANRGTWRRNKGVQVKRKQSGQERREDDEGRKSSEEMKTERCRWRGSDKDAGS